MPFFNNPPTSSAIKKPGSTVIFFFCTFNARSLLDAGQLKDFELQVGKIKFDVIGLAEVRRRGTGRLDLHSGYTLFYSGEKDQSRNGVGFFMSQKWASRVVEFVPTSPRVASVLLDVDGRKSIRLIQVYAPTSASEDVDVEAFYDDLDRAILAQNQRKATHTIILGDFNAKIGRKVDDEYAVGAFGLGERNERGQMLADFCEQRRITIGNTLFKKPAQRKWTWRSADGVTFNQIDYVLASHREIFLDVSVLNKFVTGSDHRLVRARISIQCRRTRLRQMQRWRQPKKQVERCLNRDLYVHAIENLMNGLADNEIDIDDQYAQIVDTIKFAINIATEDQPKLAKVTDETLQLLQRRRDWKRAGRTDAEYSALCKLARQRLMADLERWKYLIVTGAIENNRGLRKVRQKVSEGTRPMTSIRLPNGRLTQDRQSLLDEVQRFYNDLNRNTIPIPASRFLSDSARMAPFLDCEIEKALTVMRSGTAPGEDGVPAEALKLAKRVLVGPLCKLFNDCLASNRIPAGFADSKTILLHKKGDTDCIKNYRPISLLSTIYKTFTRTLVNRLESYLEAAQPVEQAGFRRGFSTVDHIQTVSELIEKCNEFHLPLFILFIDFEKAFDCVEFDALYNALRSQGIPEHAIHLLEMIYEHGRTTIQIGSDKTTIDILRGVRQGDNISPKAFSAVSQYVFDRIDWDEHYGINIDGAHLTHLRFADDIAILSHDFNELQQMANELCRQAERVGLKINAAKTKLVGNERILRPLPLFSISGQSVEEVREFVYLGQLIGSSTRRNEEVARRIKSGWRAFLKYKFIFTPRQTPMALKRRLFNMCVLPAMLYGSETWSLTKKEEQRLAVAQHKMERMMTGTSLRQHRSCESIRSSTLINDVLISYRRRKWRWALKIANMDNNRWTKRVTEWQPRIGHRAAGRPKRRWRDEIAAVAGRNWMGIARADGSQWRRLEERFLVAAE